eukprot:jgi/Hompol1/172/HPOL_001005-RA
MLSASEARARSRTIDAEIEQERLAARKQRSPKVLVLGSGDSGKTTFMKQIRILHGGGYNEDERRSYASLIHENVRDAVMAIAAATLTHPAISESLKPDYIPTAEDVINARSATTQITETVYNIRDLKFRFYDVGGQQKYRKQWTPYFDDSDTIIFFASIASYDQFLAEDPTINRMHDALALFGQIFNHPLLKTIPFTLFLNKKDLFEKKFAKNGDVSKFFPDFQPRTDVSTLKQAYKFFQRKFEAQCGQEKARVSVHITCCTDTKAMSVIVTNVIEDPRELREISRKIDQQLSKERQVYSDAMSEPRLLLLGSGDSGKTTFLKQIRIIHGGGFTPKEKRDYLQAMRLNIIDSAIALISALLVVEDKTLSPEAEISLQYICDQVIPPEGVAPTEANRTLTKELAAHIYRFWKDPLIADIYSKATSYRLTIQDTAYYFLDRATEFAEENYEVTANDVVHVRTPTTQITETVIRVDNINYHFFDVGGQQKYRKQWTPYFDNVHNISFVVSLASYDQNLKRTLALFVSPAAADLQPDPKSQRIKLASKIIDEWAHAASLPKPITAQLQAAQPGPKLTLKPSPSTAPAAQSAAEPSSQVAATIDSITAAKKASSTSAPTSTAVALRSQLPSFENQQSSATALVRISQPRKVPQPKWHAPWKLMRRPYWLGAQYHRR